MSRFACLIAATLLLPTLAACNHKAPESVDALDKELEGAAASGNLGNQIVVDPAVATASASRQPATPVPATTSAAAAAMPAGSKCAFAYNPKWASRLPPELPVFPGASVTEAAGSDAPGCRRRIVSFTSAASATRVIDFYRKRVTQAGYSVEQLNQQGNEVLGGTRGEAAYYITVSSSGAGVAVDLVSNGG